MRVAVTRFVTDRSAAVLDLVHHIADRGFDSLHLPEHTHVLVAREPAGVQTRRFRFGVLASSSPIMIRIARARGSASPERSAGVSKMYNLPAELQVEADGPIRIVTLNRPDALNAVNPTIGRERNGRNQQDRTEIGRAR
jgi:hypothetical protein